MSETAKHRQKAFPFCQGNVLDIGSGGDPIVPWAISMDLPVESYLGYNSNRPEMPIHFRGTADKLPFKDATLECCHSSHVLEDFPLEQWPAVLAEWDRVLKPMGFMIIAVPDHKRFRAAVSRGQGDNLAHRHESHVGELTEHLRDRYIVLHDDFVSEHPDEYSILFIGCKNRAQE